MSITPEGKIKNWLTKELQKEFPGCWIYKAPGGRYGRVGVPDLLCCILGLFVAIEVKTKVGKLSKMQEIELLKLETADSITATIYGEDYVKLKYIIDTIRAKANKL